MSKSKWSLALVVALAGGAFLVQARGSRRAVESPVVPARAPPPVRPESGGLIALSDVDYGLPGRFHPDQRLDFYQLPAALRGPAPLLILVHGGVFHSGDEQIDLDDPLYRDWLKRGWSIASVQYRLAPRTCDQLADPTYPHRSFYPEPEYDLSLAVQFLRQRAAEWNLDPQRFALRGSSAGGSLATLVGLSDEGAFLDERRGHGGSTRVRAIVNVGGPTDATFANPHVPWDFAHVGYYVDCPASVPPPSMELLFAVSPSWIATREPQNALNQLVGVRHVFRGPPGVDLHDPFYGRVLHDALCEPRVANPASFLDWERGPAAPTGLDPHMPESAWLELQFAGIPFGAGTPGALPRPPAMALVGFGPCDALLVANCLPGAIVTLLRGDAALEGPGAHGEWLAHPVELASRTADARGEALFDLDLASLAGTGQTLWLQATSSDERAPLGLATTHGLRIERP